MKAFIITTTVFNYTSASLYFMDAITSPDYAAGSATVAFVISIAYAVWGSFAWGAANELRQKLRDAEVRSSLR